MKRKRINIRSSSTGNLAEYLLPALMIGGLVLISITGLLQSNLFQNTQTQALLQANGISKDTQGKGLLNIKTMGQNPFDQPYQYKTADGKLITIPNFPTDLAAAVEVDGGHGTSEKLLAAMEAWIQAMVEAGEITPTEANLLKKLSNQGHSIANNIGILEKATLACQTKSCIFNKIWGTPTDNETKKALFHLARMSNVSTSIEDRNNSVPMSSQDRKTLYELAPWIEAVGNEMNYTGKDANNVRVSKMVQTFLQDFQNAQNALSKISPQSKGLLSYFSSSILNLGLRTAMSTSEIAWGDAHYQTEEINLNHFRNQTITNAQPQQILTVLASWTAVDEAKNKSALAHANANGICQMGQGESKPTACQ